MLFTWLCVFAIGRLLNSWSRDSCTLLTTSSDFTAVLWDVLHGTVLREVQCNTMVLQGSLNPRNRCRASSLPWHPCCLARVFTNSRTSCTHIYTQRTSGAVLLQSGPVLSQLSEQYSGVTCSSSTQHCGSCCSSCCKRASGTKSQSPSRGQSALPCWLRSVGC